MSTTSLEGVGEQQHDDYEDDIETEVEAIYEQLGLDMEEEWMKIEMHLANNTHRNTFISLIVKD
jgi:hypothetical protein